LRDVVDVLLGDHPAGGVRHGPGDRVGDLAAGGVVHWVAMFAADVVAGGGGGGPLAGGPDPPADRAAGALLLVGEARPGAVGRRAGAGVEPPRPRQTAGPGRARARLVVRLDAPRAAVDHDLPLAPDRLVAARAVPRRVLLRDGVVARLGHRVAVLLVDGAVRNRPHRHLVFAVDGSHDPVALLADVLLLGPAVPPLAA